MIDTDKMRAAYAATPLCQNAWTKRDGDTSDPTKLCAVSAMVSYAGVQPDLIYKMDVAYPNGQWVGILAVPVLQAEYGVPHAMVNEIVRIFDKSENEWRGVQEVLALCERHNMAVMRDEAINEDATRFPQHTCEQSDLIAWSESSSYMTLSKYNLYLNDIPFAKTAKPKKAKKSKALNATGASKFWTAPTTPMIAKKHTGGLLVGA